MSGPISGVDTGVDTGADAEAAAGTALPRISVVVPTFRRPALLRRCLVALLQQTLPAEAVEIVVADDGHDDATREVVATLAALPWPSGAPVLRYLRPAHGKGPAVARNAGWRAARAPLVAFTDDDTVAAPDWLAAGLRAMDGSACVALAGRVVVPPATMPRDGRPAAPTDHERMTQGLAAAAFVTANAFVRRATLERVGGFDERFRRAWREDSDLQFRLERDAGPVGRCPQARVLHPVRAERWGVSLRQQRNVFYDALLYREHPRRYRAELRRHPPWNYHAIVAAALAVPLLAATGHPAPAAACAALALGGIGAFALRRLRGTSHRPGHVLEMLATSALIPFLSLYWRWRGAWHFRVWFP